MVTDVSSDTIASEGTGRSDYKLDTRYLNENDQANQPLPYDDITLQCSEAVSNGNQVAVTWNATDDWGVGKAFYMSGIIVWFAGAGQEFFKLYEDQVLVYLEDSESEEKFFVKSFSGLDTNVGQTTSLGWGFAKTFHFPHLRKVLPTQVLQLYVHNASGQAFMAEVYINGIAK